MYACYIICQGRTGVGIQTTALHSAVQPYIHEIALPLSIAGAKQL